MRTQFCVEAVLPLLRRALAAAATEPERSNSGTSVLALRLSLTTGREPRNEHRKLLRILRGEVQSLSVRVADEIATLLGYYPGQIWPEWELGVRMDDDEDC